MHGLAGAAGQPAALAAALRRQGIDAKAVQIGKSKFRYDSDIYFTPGANRVESYCDMFGELIDRFDIFHFHARSFLYTDPTNLAFPHLWDLAILRLAGKKIAFHFRGSEIRLHSQFRQRSPFHYVDEDPNQLVSRFPELTMRLSRNAIRALAHRVFVTDPELQGYVPGSRIIPRAINLGLWRDVGSQDGDNPLVIHAPSRRIVKGTGHLLAAVSDLREEGLRFRFQLVEGLPNDQARRIYEDADIVVDQLRIGWYGVLATESMALGKATVSYIREDLVSHLGDPLPLAVANPATIRDVLKTLILDGSRRRRLGAFAREYCERHHCADRIAMSLRDEYLSLDHDDPPIESEALMDLIRHQAHSGLRHLGDAHQMPSRATSRLKRLRGSLQERGFLGTIGAATQIARRRLFRHP